MKAVELSGYEGFQSLRVVEVEKPSPGAQEILIEVKAAGINYTEIELTCVPALLDLISRRHIKLFANTSFPLTEVKDAFEALSSRQTIGKVVLVPRPERQSLTDANSL